MNIYEAAQIMYGMKPKTAITDKCYHGCGRAGVVPIFRCTDDAVIGAECYQCLKARQMAELEEIEEERAAIALERGE